jgi:hypothetical protein
VRPFGGFIEKVIPAGHNCLPVLRQRGNNFPFKMLQWRQSAVFGPFLRWHEEC